MALTCHYCLDGVFRQRSTPKAARYALSTPVEQEAKLRAELKARLNAAGYLVEPALEAKVEDGEDQLGNPVVGTCSMQGWRLRMEDAHSNTLSFNGDPRSGLFAVFDGHGGPEVSTFAAWHLPDIVVKTMAELQTQVQQHTESLKKALLQIDQDIFTEWIFTRLFAANCGEMKAPDPYSPESPGSTALVCLLKHGVMHFAHLGDCRAVLCRGGVALPLTLDHNLERDAELLRVLSAGGHIIDGRVNGCLNLTRALGDFYHKQCQEGPGILPPEDQPISVIPDVFSYPIAPEDEFLILGCDGVWEEWKPQEVVNFIKARRAANKGARLSDVAKELLDELVAPDIFQSRGRGCDNMTCSIIDLANFRS